MYNSTTKRYTLEDASGSFEWTIEATDRTEITFDVAQEIAQIAFGNTLERDLYDMEERAEGITFPAFGYSTTHTYNDIEDYITQKHEEILADLEESKKELVQWLVEQVPNWEIA